MASAVAGVSIVSTGAATAGSATSTATAYRASGAAAPVFAAPVFAISPGRRLAGGSGRLLLSSDGFFLSQKTRPRSATRKAARNVVSAALKTKTPAEADWKTKREFLLKQRVRSVSPRDAYRLQQEQGYTIIDVRPEGDYNDSHPAGAINVQVYRLIKDWKLWDITRRVAFAFFGIFQGTEENPNFVNEVKAVVDKDAKIIVACIAGGTVKPTSSLAEGSQSRSLIAAYVLGLEGFTNVVHLEGGLKEWFKQDLPVE